MSLPDLETIADAKNDFAFALAHCEGCADYHATRPYLLLSGERRGAARDREMFASVLRRYLPEGGSLLLGGSADAGLVATASDVLGAQLGAVAVADRCPAPLRAVGRYAARHGLAVSTFERDLTAAEPFGSYDVILAHLILGFLSPDGRIAYLKLMRSMLNPGGTLVVVSGMPRAKRPPLGQRVDGVMAALHAKSVPLPEAEADFRRRLEEVMAPVDVLAAPDSLSAAPRFDAEAFRRAGGYDAAGLTIVETLDSVSNDGRRDWARQYVVARPAS